MRVSWKNTPCGRSGAMSPLTPEMQNEDPSTRVTAPAPTAPAGAPEFQPVIDPNTSALGGHRLGILPPCEPQTAPTSPPCSPTLNGPDRRPMERRRPLIYAPPTLMRAVARVEPARSCAMASRPMDRDPRWP